MLRPTIRGTLAVSMVGAGLVMVGEPKGVECPESEISCIVTAERPAAPGATTASASGSDVGLGCVVPNSTRSVPCSSDLWGAFNNTDGCYYLRIDVPPDPSHWVWAGDSPENRSVYQRECLLPGGGTSNSGWVVLADLVGGPVVTASPAEVAQQAIAQMTLLAPEIATAPPSGGLGLVGVPVWMWSAVTPSTWGPVSATAEVTGVSVTAAANASHVVWEMGDGQTVICDGPGTPYSDGSSAASPDCGHVYGRSSAGQPDDRFTVTATTTWNITWVGGGQSGSLTTTRASSTQLQIGELQVLNQ